MIAISSAPITPEDAEVKPAANADPSTQSLKQLSFDEISKVIDEKGNQKPVPVAFLKSESPQVKKTTQPGVSSTTRPSIVSTTSSAYGIQVVDDTNEISESPSPFSANNRLDLKNYYMLFLLSF